MQINKIKLFYEALENKKIDKTKIEDIFVEAVNEVKDIYNEKTLFMNENEIKKFKDQTIRLLREMESDVKKGLALSGIALGSGAAALTQAIKRPKLAIPLAAISAASSIGSTIYSAKHMKKEIKKWNEFEKEHTTICEKKFSNDSQLKAKCKYEVLVKALNSKISILQKMLDNCPKSENPKKCLEETKNLLNRYKQNLKGLQFNKTEKYYG